MNTYISLLRGINVSGQKQMRMEALRGLYEFLGFEDVQSYLQSGNVVFKTEEGDMSKVAARIEAGILQALGYSVTVVLRDPDQLHEIFTSNPFLTARSEDPGRLYVTFLAAIPSAADLRHLATTDTSTDEYFVAAGHVFLFCPQGYGRTRFSNAFFERRLHMAATTRNWKTVTALHDMVHADEGQ